jgi:predicted transcriptional regulator
MKEIILKKLRKDVKKHSLSGMADKIKMPYTNLYRIVKGVGTCTMKTWEKIETYYSQQVVNHAGRPDEPNQRKHRIAVTR